MITADVLCKTIEELPQGLELFIPADIANAIYGAEAAHSAINALAKKYNCAVGLGDSFKIEPERLGYRIVKNDRTDAAADKAAGGHETGNG